VSFARLVRSRRSAYVALAVLTVVWGTNWIWLKLALDFADPIVYNVHRIWTAIVVLFLVMLWQRKLAWPAAWKPILVTAFFQVTLNFFATTIAIAEAGVGRTSVLVFTMPFWTLLIAWPVLGERVSGTLWVAIALAFAGLVLVVAPWNLSGALAPRLWAVLSGFGWAAGTVATKYYQARYQLEMTGFLFWQMVVGVIPLTLLPWVITVEPTQWTPAYAALLLWTAAAAIVFAFLLWIAVLRHLPAGTASLNMFAILVIALVSAVVLFDERLAGSDWAGIGLITAGLAILAWRTLAAAEPEPPPSSTGGS
jgi:drug/metabolite transporter (DMT)-like permease